MSSGKGGCVCGENGEFGFDTDGDGKADIFYRSMSKEHFEQLKKSKKLGGTTETSITQSQDFASEYGGYLVRMTTKPGTKKKLEDMAITANDPAATEYPHLPTQKEFNTNNPNSKWGDEVSRVKIEGKDLTIQLGKEDGKALNTFNENITEVELIEVIPKEVADSRRAARKVKK